MKKKNRRITRSVILLTLFAAIAYTVYSSLTKDQVAVLQVGDPAPDFELASVDGQVYRLSDYTKQGKGVFLNFWGTWCEPCEREMPAMERQYHQFAGENFEMIAVNIAQSKLEVSKYVEQMGMTFPVVIDANKSVLTAYNITPLPTTILIDPEGKVKRIVTGEMTDQSIEHYIESILPAT